jgi:hypothetical protein
MNLGLPDWSELIGVLARELDLEPEDCYQTDDFLQVAEYYLLEKGDSGPLRNIMNRFLEPGEDAIRNSEIHETLVELNFPIIYTTNYDEIIESAYRLLGVPCHAISDMDDLMTAPNGVTQIVKIHGTYSKIGGIVLTESHYFSRLEFETAIDIKFKHDILSSTILFLGYSFRDINIRYRIYEMMKFKHQVRKSRAQQPTAVFTDFSVDKVRKRVLTNRGIPVVELKDDDKAKRVAEFLNALR